MQGDCDRRRVLDLHMVLKILFRMDTVRATGSVLMEMNRWGGGDWCHDGIGASCCEGRLVRNIWCYWADVGASCDDSGLLQIFSHSVLTNLEEAANIIFKLAGPCRTVPLAGTMDEALLLVLDELDSAYEQASLDCPLNAPRLFQRCWLWKNHGPPLLIYSTHRRCHLARRST